jgi:hypothetical protein
MALAALRPTEPARVLESAGGPLQAKDGRSATHDHSDPPISA